MKKVIAIFFTFCLIVGSFAGGTSIAKAATSSKKKVTITYMASQDWVKPEEQTLAKTFAAQSGITVNFQIVPSAQYPNMLLAKLASGECTDIYGNNIDPNSLQTIYNVQKNAVSLSKESWVKDLDPLTASMSTVNGKLYGLTYWDVSSQWVIVYNKSIFAKYKLAVPKTFAQFETVCQTIKNNGITPIYECVSDGWHHVLWFPELGGALLGPNNTLVNKLNNNTLKWAGVPNALKDLQQVMDMVNKGYWGTDYMSQTFADTEKNMASGKFAMTIGNLAEPALIASEYKNVKTSDFGFFADPLLDNQYQDINPVGPTKFIWSGSKNISAAKQYLDFLMEKSTAQTYVNKEPKTNMLPFPGLKLTNKYDADINKYFSTYTKKQIVAQISVKYVNAFWMDLGKDMSGMLVGTTKPQQVLTEMDQSMAQSAAAAKDSAWSK